MLHQQEQVNYHSISNTSEKDQPILCPFLQIVQPRIDSMWPFLVDCKAHGLDYILGFPVAFVMVLFQQGLWNALTGCAVDTARLDQIPNVSHDDRYSVDMQTTEAYLRERSNQDGSVHMQDLIDLKEEQASNLGLNEVAFSSRLESSLLFLGADGNVETGKVKIDTVLSFLSGQIDYRLQISSARLNKIKKVGVWKGK